MRVTYALNDWYEQSGYKHKLYSFAYQMILHTLRQNTNPNFYKDNFSGLKEFVKYNNEAVYSLRDYAIFKDVHDGLNNIFRRVYDDKVSSKLRKYSLGFLVINIRENRR